MYNDLFHIGGFTVHSYGLMIAIGVLFAFGVGMYRAKKKGLDPDFVFDVGFYSMIAGLIGTRILYYITELPAIIKDPSILWDFNNGYVVYGGIIGGVSMGLYYCKRKKKNFFEYFDLIMPSIILAQGFGRIGCFLAGCCYGIQTDLPIGITFHHSDMAPNGVKLMPTQLISSAGDFLMFFILIHYAKKRKKAGQVGALYFILYSIGRFFVEFLRDDYRGSIGFLSTSQIISLGILLFGIVFYLIKKGKTDQRMKLSEEAATEELAEEDTFTEEEDTFSENEELMDEEQEGEEALEEDSLDETGSSDNEDDDEVSETSLEDGYEVVYLNHSNQ